MYQNTQAQETFEQRVGYGRFRKQLSTIITPTKEILLELLNLVIIITIIIHILTSAIIYLITTNNY